MAIAKVASQNFPRLFIFVPVKSVERKYSAAIFLNLRRGCRAPATIPALKQRLQNALECLTKPYTIRYKAACATNGHVLAKLGRSLLPLQHKFGKSLADGLPNPPWKMLKQGRVPA